MTGNLIELHVLGELKVVRGGAALPLPPSKKTRALLAYLAMNPRSFRREQLCELLWELPDDPRGSLRWSLSKIRALVDTPEQQRIDADRNHIRFNPAHTRIDAQQLYSLVSSDLDRIPLAELQQAADTFTGQFLEGLELTDFYTFYSWCMAEREKVAEARGRILGTLVSRLQEEPEQALVYARALVLNSPYEESVRARLIRLLVEAGRADEAEQQYQLGKRMLEESGAEPSGQLFQAWRGTPGATRAARPPTPTADTAPRPAVARTAETGPLVGRDAEIRQFDDMLNHLAEPQEPQLVLLQGAPGMGKTRLLEALQTLAEQRQYAVLRARALVQATLRPFSLWVDAIRRQDPHAEKSIFGSTDGDREKLFAALNDYLDSLSARQPALLLFDDVQWCDDSSSAALQVIAAHSRRHGLLVVMAAREAELSDNSSLQHTLQALRSGGQLRELHLPPLSEQAICSLIREQTDHDTCERLSRECAGNPLLALELAKAMTTEGQCATLDDLVRSRLQTLELDAADVLRWAAVLNNRLDLETLAQLSDQSADEVGQALELGEQLGLLVSSESGWRFTHDLLAQSVYQGISPTRQRVMHRKIAQLLEATMGQNLSAAADLAHHASQSGDAALAARALISAGRLCLRFFANRDACNLVNRGLRLVQQLAETEQVCLTLELIEIRLAATPTGQWQETAPECIALAEKALDHGAIRHARLGYYMASYIRWSHGEWAAAREESLQAERVTRAGSEEEHILGMAEAARCLAMVEQDLARADAMLMEASALAQRRQLRLEAINAAGGMLRFHENRLDEAVELFMDARTQAKAAGDRISEFQANEYLLMIDLERGNFRQAAARSRELIDLGDKLREGSEAPFARALSGLCVYALEDDDGPLQAAIDELRDVDAKHRLAYALTRSALLDCERGRTQQARSRATEALSCAEILGRATEQLLAHIALAQVHLAEGDNGTLQQHLAAVTRLMEQPVASWARARAGLLLQQSPPGGP